MKKSLITFLSVSILCGSTAFADSVSISINPGAKATIFPLSLYGAVGNNTSGLDDIGNVMITNLTDVTQNIVLRVQAWSNVLSGLKDSSGRFDPSLASQRNVVVDGATIFSSLPIVVGPKNSPNQTYILTGASFSGSSVFRSFISQSASISKLRGSSTYTGVLTGGQLPDDSFIIKINAFESGTTRFDGRGLGEGAITVNHRTSTGEITYLSPIDGAVLPILGGATTFSWNDLGTFREGVSVKYKFEIVDAENGGVYISKLVSGTLLSIDFQNSSLYSSLSNGLIKSGKRYKWRVSAFDTTGTPVGTNNGVRERFFLVAGNPRDDQVSTALINAVPSSIGSGVASVPGTTRQSYQVSFPDGQVANVPSLDMVRNAIQNWLKSDSVILKYGGLKQGDDAVSFDSQAGAR